MADGQTYINRPPMNANRGDMGRKLPQCVRNPLEQKETFSVGPVVEEAKESGQYVYVSAAMKRDIQGYRPIRRHEVVGDGGPAFPGSCARMCDRRSVMRVSHAG